jgi:hypothetical protein
MLFFFKINNIKKTLMETNSADCSSLVGDKITFNKVLDKMGLYKLKQ